AGSRADLPGVGDWVLADVRAREARATIHRILNRSTRFSRGAAGRPPDEQIVAANVDRVPPVTSFNPDFNAPRNERYLPLARESGGAPIIAVNKADLCDEPEAWTDQLGSIAQGVPILITSALRGDGIAELGETLRAGGTTAFLGSSGSENRPSSTR